ncbi:MAG TPA: adenosylcobinamide-phosphate synthase CbiB [Thiohalobacter sp.]|nr:adenosylcobinamide-phosphate synthase CbiB [Thiohalobacter sp.]
MSVAFVVFAALALDAWLGEPRRWHPLVGFGRLAQWLEQRLYADAVVRGALVLGLLLVPFVMLAFLLESLPMSVLPELLLLYLAVGGRSLAQHAGRVRAALQRDDLPAARQQLSRMVSRDPRELDAGAVAGATVESVLENGNDAVFGAIFWYVVAGAPGLVLYRLSNTLDAMWGYRDARYARFGRAAARLDDLLNLVPARLTALSYALLGNVPAGLRCWRAQGAAWKSPNAGPVMAAGAGSLGVLLGGSACYGGRVQVRPRLGAGRAPQAADIDQALRLVRRSMALWLGLLFMGGICVDYFR